MLNSWWTDEDISSVCNESFVTREIGSKKNQDALRRPLAFGDGLTNDSYLDWILDRGRRFFLILHAIGIPDAIFSIVDQSFVDDDLPISQNDLWEHNLFGSKSETMDKRFYREQFKYLIKPLQPGGHVEYEADDIVPLEPVAKRTPVAGSSSYDKVTIHKRLFIRKKVSTSGDNGVGKVQFALHLTALLTIKHSHLVDIWATYSQDDYSYMLISPASDLSLKLFLEDQPKNFKQLDKAEKREILLRWIHCLSSALAYLHNKGFIHSTLRPSSILIDDRNSIYINEYSALKLLDGEDTSKSYRAEIYEHAAPENWSRRPSLHDLPALKTVLPGGGRTARKIPPKEPHRAPPSRQGMSDDANRPRSETTSSSSSSTSRPRNAIITTFRPSGSENDASCPADVFSLSTLIILIVSLALSHTPKAFAAHRCRHNRQAGRGGAPPDVSFHVNLGQVLTWMDILQQEAKQKSKKDKKPGDAEMWSAMSGMVKACKKTLKKDPKERLTARELERETRRYLEKGVGVAARWCCGGEEEEVAPGVSFDAPTEPDLEGDQGQVLGADIHPKSLTKTKRPKDTHQQQDLQKSTTLGSRKGDRDHPTLTSRATSSSSSLTIEPASKDRKGGKGLSKGLPKPKAPISLVAARIAREKEDLARSKEVLAREQHDLVKEKRDLEKMRKNIAVKEREIQKQEEAIFLRPETGRTTKKAIPSLASAKKSASFETVDGTSAIIQDYDTATTRSMSLGSLDASTTAPSFAMHHSVFTERTSPPPRIPEEEDSLSDETTSRRTHFMPPSDDEWPLNSNHTTEPQPLSSPGSPDTPNRSPTFSRSQIKRHHTPRFHQSNSSDTLQSVSHDSSSYLSSSVDALSKRPLPDVPPLQPKWREQAQQRKRASSVNMPPPVIPTDPFEKLRKRVERAAKEDRLRTLEALEGGPRSPGPPILPSGNEADLQSDENRHGYALAEAKLREAYGNNVDVGLGEVEWLAL